MSEKHCSATVRNKGGGFWSPPCSRPATGDDGLCGVHRAGRRKREASSAAWDARWAREQAQSRFVAAWRTEHAADVWGSDHWTCPLCGSIEQSDHVDQPLELFVKAHQRMHGDDWLTYESAGMQPAAAQSSTERAQELTPTTPVILTPAVPSDGPLAARYGERGILDNESQHPPH